MKKVIFALSVIAIVIGCRASDVYELSAEGDQESVDCFTGLFVGEQVDGPINPIYFINGACGQANSYAVNKQVAASEVVFNGQRATVVARGAAIAIQSGGQTIDIGHLESSERGLEVVLKPEFSMALMVGDQAGLVPYNYQLNTERVAAIGAPNWAREEIHITGR